MVGVRPFGDSSTQAAQRETDRLAALERLDILDTPRDEGFERFVRLIKEIFTVDIALVSFIDGHRQWYKSCAGLAADEVAREDSFCQFVVDGEQPIVVSDATLDPRFATHPAVTGDAHIRFYAGVPLRTNSGHTVGTVCAIDRRPRGFSNSDLSILQEIAGAAMDRAELLQSAGIDSLTGSMTRRAFKQEGARLLSLAALRQNHVACIVLDVDHFKVVNDTYGHAAGDTVLKHVADTCRQQLGGGDLFGRLGGEEFAILLPQISKGEAIVVAEKLREALAGTDVQMPKGTLNVTASFGVTAMSIVQQDIDTILAHADAAMYRAKEAGRNRCTLWSGNGISDEWQMRKASFGLAKGSGQGGSQDGWQQP